jgi:hypothetical protein
MRKPRASAQVYARLIKQSRRNNLMAAKDLSSKMQLPRSERGEPSAPHIAKGVPSD